MDSDGRVIKLTPSFRTDIGFDPCLSKDLCVLRMSTSVLRKLVEQSQIMNSIVLCWQVSGGNVQDHECSPFVLE